MIPLTWMLVMAGLSAAGGVAQSLIQNKSAKEMTASGDTTKALGMANVEANLLARQEAYNAVAGMVYKGVEGTNWDEFFAAQNISNDGIDLNSRTNPDKTRTRSGDPVSEKPTQTTGYRGSRSGYSLTGGSTKSNVGKVKTLMNDLTEEEMAEIWADQDQSRNSRFSTRNDKNI